MYNNFQIEEMKKSFIKQTSIDYTISYNIVKNLYETDYENLYDRLEEILHERNSVKC